MLPNDCHARFDSMTNAESSSGSKEKALSTPLSARERVKCFSMTVAPNEIDAKGTPIPVKRSLSKKKPG